MMKKQITTVLGAVLLAFSANAQSDVISTYFSEYQDREDVTTITLSGKAFELAAQVDVDEDMEDYKEMASQITGMRVIVDDNDTDAKSTAREAVKRLPGTFEELLTVKEKDTHVKMLIDESNGVVNELVAVVGSENTFVVMSLVGDMNLKDLGPLTQQLANASSSAFEGMEEFTKEVKIYPNPVEVDGQVNVRFSDDFAGANVSVFNASGAQVKSFIAKEGQNRMDISGLEKGVYVVKTQSEDKEVSGKFVIQ